MNLTDEQIRQRFETFDKSRYEQLDVPPSYETIEVPILGIRYFSNDVQVRFEYFKAALSLQGEAVPYGYIREDNFLLGDIIKEQCLTKDKVEPDDVPLFTSPSLTTAQQSEQRLQSLRKLCGYVENGTSETVCLYQDDATKEWVVSVGADLKIRKYFTGSNLTEALDAAILALLPEEGKSDE